MLDFQENFPDQVLRLGSEAALFQCTRLHRHPGGWHLNINPNKFIFRENEGKISRAKSLGLSVPAALSGTSSKIFETFCLRSRAKRFRDNWNWKPGLFDVCAISKTKNPVPNMAVQCEPDIGGTPEVRPTTTWPAHVALAPTKILHSYTCTVSDV